MYEEIVCPLTYKYVQISQYVRRILYSFKLFIFFFTVTRSKKKTFLWFR